MSLSKTMTARIDRFREEAEANDWEQGTTLSRTAMARIFGWSYMTLSYVIRAIKEHPESGMSISTRRGPYPYTVVSLTGSKLTSGTSEVVSKISNSYARENLQRLVRATCTSFVAYRHSDKKTSGGRMMKPYTDRLSELLQSLRAQAVRDGDPYEIQEMVERALAQVGIRYSDNGTDDE
jgi:hypothetical protein